MSKEKNDQTVNVRRYKDESSNTRRDYNQPRIVSTRSIVQDALATAGEGED